MALATRAASTTQPLPNVIVYLWEGLDGDDVGSVVLLPNFPDKSVQIGAAGGKTHGGGTTVIQGSNDPLAATDPDNAATVWFTLVDPQGNAITTTADKIEQILENPLYIRPKQTGGTGADLDIVLVCKR